MACLMSGCTFEHVGRIDADRVPGPKRRKIVRVAVAIHNQSPSNCSKSGM